ncbi:MAG TPA: hypothetical protein VIY27_02055 [Myxococcota bacterium]
MKLGMVMPLWGRAELARLTLRRAAVEAEAASVPVTLVAVTDEWINGDIACYYGFEVVSAPNSPLSDKKNAGVIHLRGRVDGVVFLGSDDWATGTSAPNFFDKWAEVLEEHAAFGPLDLWYADLETGNGLYSAGYPSGPRHHEPVGAARALRADVLDLVGWAPRPSGMRSSHDGAMKTLLLSHGVDICKPRLTQDELGVRIVDIKSETSVTSFGLLSTLRNDPRKWRTVFAPFPEEEVIDLETLVGPTFSTRDGKRGKRKRSGTEQPLDEETLRRLRRRRNR